MGKHFLVPPKLDTVAAAAGKIWTASDSDGNGDWVDHDTVYYKQGGNAFSDTAVLGTTDNYDLQLKTNDIQWAVLKNTGELGIGRETTAQQRLTVNYGNLRFNTVPQPGNHTASLAGLGAGNLSNGTYYYVVIPVTIYGDCGYNQRSNSSVVVVDNTVNGQIQLTNIPVFAEKYQVIARKIYRTRIGESNTSARYLTIINDNTTTTYLDNTADASLPNGRVYGKPDMSSAVIYKNGELMMFADTYNTSFGEGALGSAVNADGITAIGANAGGSITDAIGGVFIGNNAGMSITTGQSNVFIASSGNGLTTGTYNVGIGGAMVAIGSVASNNICLGREAGGRVTAEYNVFIGRYAGRYQGTGSYNIGFGSNTMHGVSGTTPTGSYNFSAGYLAMGSGALTSAAQNIAIGYTSLRFLVSGSSNIAFGSSSGTSVTTGAINIFIGSSSGSTLQTGSYNMYIGHSVAASAIDISNEFRLGYSTTLLLNGHMGTGPFLNVPVEFRTAGDVVFNGIGTATESNVLYYNTTTKKITYGAAPSSSVSFGLENQIPYTNAAVNNFDYSSKFSWNNTAGILLIDQTLRSPNSTGTGIHGKDLIIKAGNAWNADATSDEGSLYLSPGNAFDSLYPSSLYIGDPTYAASSINLRTTGSQSNVGLDITTKGSSSIRLQVNSSGTTRLYNGAYVHGVIFGFFSDSNVSIWGPPAQNIKPPSIALRGGSVTASPPGNYDGGDVHIYGAEGVGTGARGDIYFGDGSNGYLPGNGNGTSVVLYNRTTGKLTYGDMSTGGSMVYPTGSGIPIVVSGASWGTTITDNSTNWNTAHGWGNHSGLYINKSVCITSNTQDSDFNKWTKFATVNIDGQWVGYRAKLLAFSDFSTTSGRHGEINLHIYQAAAHGTHPTLTIENRVSNPSTTYSLGYVIVQNTPVTIVELYVNIATSYTSLRFVELVKGTQSTVTYWNDAGFATTVTGLVNATNTIPYDSGNIGTGVSTHIPFWTGANTMGSSANLVWDNSTSNVGIGTPPNTDAKLHLYSGGTTKLRIDGAAGAVGLHLTSYGSAGHSYIDSTIDDSGYNMYFRMRTNGTPVNALTLLGTGNVSIGIVTPGVRFVNSGGALASSPTLGSGTIGSNAILSQNGLYGLYTGVSNNGDVWMQSQRNDASTTVYNILLNPAGGNVGIGTTSPISGSKVDIRGKLAINPTVTAGSALHVQAESGDTNLARFFNSDYASGVGSGIRVFTGAATGNTYTAIQAYQAGAGATNDFILQPVGGNVGIGTTDPSHTLDVNGSFRSTLQPQVNLNSNETIDNTNYQTYAGKIVYVNGAYTITIASTCPVDFHATFIRNAAGEVTFAGGTSPATVTIYSSGNKKRIDVRYEAAYIHMYSSASCYLTGALKT